MSSTRRVLVRPGYESMGTVAGVALAAAPGQPFDVPATLGGSTAHVTVYYETHLGGAGARLAADVLLTCERDNGRMAAWFGVPPLKFTIVILKNPGGAYHYGCRGTVLYCDSGSSGASDHTRMLMVAEGVEVYEAAQKKGWNCGASAGEGLSRVLATELYPAQLDGFATANDWLNTAKRTDWVTRSKGTDTDYISIGCSVLFLNWLRGQLGFTWEQIVQAGGKTLEETYQKLTSKSGAFAPFRHLLDQHFPLGKHVSLADDNPFPLA